MALCVLVILICFHADTLTLAAAFLLDEDLNFGVSGFQFVLDLGDQHISLFNDDAVAVISKLEVAVPIGRTLWAELSLGRKKLV